ncbi:MAG: hypothetical protein ABSF84_06470 [Acidimicrobiales bacterium]
MADTMDINKSFKPLVYRYIAVVSFLLLGFGVGITAYAATLHGRPEAVLIGIGNALLTAGVVAFLWNALVERWTNQQREKEIEALVDRLELQVVQRLTEEHRTLVREHIGPISESAGAIEKVVMPIFQSARFGRTSKYQRVIAKYVLNQFNIVRDNGESLRVHRDDGILLWRDCLVESDSWKALSFAPDLWAGDELAVSIAFHRVRNNLPNKDRIQRVLVLRDSAELYAQRNLLTMLRTFGVDVKWILLSRLQELTDARGIQWESAAMEGNLDFAIMDNNLVLQFKLDGREKLEAAVLTRREEDVVRAKALFDVAYFYGEEVQDARDQAADSDDPSTRFA